jgi:hypothetical protein
MADRPISVKIVPSFVLSVVGNSISFFDFRGGINPPNLEFSVVLGSTLWDGDSSPSPRD